MDCCNLKMNLDIWRWALDTLRRTLDGLYVALSLYPSNSYLQNLKNLWERGFKFMVTVKNWITINYHYIKWYRQIWACRCYRSHIFGFPVTMGHQLRQTHRDGTCKIILVSTVSVVKESELNLKSVYLTFIGNRNIPDIPINLW